MSFLNPFNYIKGKSSDHFSNAFTYAQKTTVAGGEAIGYATLAGANVGQVCGQAFMGGSAAFGMAGGAMHINAALSAGSIVTSCLSPIASAFKTVLILAVQYPLAAMGVGAITGIAISPQSTINAVKNIGNTIYKVGETAIDAAITIEECLIGTALLAKETTDSISDYFYPHENEQLKDGELTLVGAAELNSEVAISA